MAKEMFLSLLSTVVWGLLVFVKLERFRSRAWRIFSWAMFLLSVAGVVGALLDATGLLSRL